jgi:hypothetical protein
VVVDGVAGSRDECCCRCYLNREEREVDWCGVEVVWEEGGMGWFWRGFAVVVRGGLVERRATEGRRLMRNVQLLALC